MLATESSFEIVGSVDNGQAAVDLIAVLHPDIVLMDVEMPVMGGLVATRLIHQRFPKTQVLIVTSYDNQEYQDKAIKAGAKGYLLKQAAEEDLLHAIRLIHESNSEMRLESLEITDARTSQPVVMTASAQSSPSGATGSPERVMTATALTSVDRGVALRTAAIQSVQDADTSALTPFDMPVILQASPIWSRAVIWGIVGVTAFTIIWATLTKIEQAIRAQGKLEPQGTVKDIQSPINGVVRAIYVKDGQTVKPGDRLLSLDPTAAQAQIKSLESIRTGLMQESQFYQTLLRNPGAAVLSAAGMAQLKLPANLFSLAENRAALVAENQLYQAEAQGTTAAIGLNPQQRQRLQSSQAEYSSRVAAAQQEVVQLQQQLNQAQTQLTNTQDILDSNQKILEDVKPVAIEGGIARLQFRRQEQEVLKGQSEVQRLTQEKARLQAAIAQAQEKLQNTIALSRKDLLTQIAENQKQIAVIDSQFSKVMLENQKQISEIDSQLSQAKLTLKYQELRSPVAGTVFDLQAHAAGYVATASQPILKIVPTDNLIAKVFITNRDIGFVNEGMTADVRIDSFPFSEFGDIKGQVISIGSDALPPDPIRPFYSFPAQIRLDSQSLKIKGRDIPLQSGMSISANLKLRQRTVLSVFTDLFTRKAETLKFVR
jgi:HlyD family secretion protein